MAPHVSMGTLYTKLVAVNWCRICAMRTYNVIENVL